MSVETYLVNVNPGGDVIHADPPHESCNTDDASDLHRRVTAQEVEQLVNEGRGRYCRHCYPELAE